MKRKMGLTDLAIKNCTKAIELNPTYLKALLRRAEIYEETEKLGEFSSICINMINDLRIPYLCLQLSLFV